MRENFVLPVKYEQEQKENCLSSFGGVPIFLEFLKGIGFDRMVSSKFATSSDQGFHPLHHLLTLVLINLTGGESVSDVDRLEEDAGLKRFFQKYENKFAGLRDRVFRKGRERIFPSPSRIFTFLDRFNSDKEEEERQSTPKGQSKILPVADDFKKLVLVNGDIVATAHRLSPSQTATMDMDNNLIISQKRNTEISYKKKPSYQPFNVYWAEQDLMLLSEFRDGNVPPGKDQTRLLREAEALLPGDIKKLRLRSDSAGYQHKLLEYMESGRSRFGKIKFTVSCDVSKSFRQAVQQVDENDWQAVVYTDENGYLVETAQEVAEVCFVPETTNKRKNAPVFRYLATREAVDIQYQFEDNGQITYLTSEYVEQKLHLEEMNKKVYKVFGIVTNESGSPLDLLLWHRKRCGNSEQEHSRLTNDMAGGRFPSDSFGENAAWWYMSIISLNLLKLFQRYSLPRHLHRVRIKKLNGIMFRVAIKVLKRSRSLLIRIGRNLPLSDLVIEGRNKIARIHKVLRDSKIWIKNEALLI
ncbi:MAG: IS1380 family transposase [Deltaproteobacteria bacterium]|nr:IS1380 family transposase [Deltaproteobacteria bacterium]